MRKLLFSFLLATTAATIATPAVAQRGDRDSAEAREERQAQREQARRERAEAREERQQAESERRVRTEDRVQRDAPVQRRITVEERNLAADRAARVERGTGNVNERGRPTLELREQRERLSERVQQDRREVRERRVADGDLRTRWPRVRPPEGARPDRPAPPPQTTSHRRSHPDWRRADWRRDHRYDWRRWRDRNRSRFHLGFYFDPFGWNYRRYGIGWRLWPSYYNRHYWLNDPWSYRLPYAPWPYQWIRYWDDAVLVNTITGQIVDIEYNFFW